MTPSEASQILEALARGIDPETGEVFAEDSPLNNTHVVRALFMGAFALTEPAVAATKAKREVAEGLENAWKPWTEEEEKRLLKAFDNGATVEELALVHRRKRGGIAARLEKLGRLESGQSGESAA